MAKEIVELTADGKLREECSFFWVIEVHNNYTVRHYREYELEKEGISVFSCYSTECAAIQACIKSIDTAVTRLNKEIESLFYYKNLLSGRQAVSFIGNRNTDDEKIDGMRI